jgi:hypothetical protein
MKTLLRFSLALPGALMVAACGSGGGEAEGASAKSEVLKGSVSDEMIAYDALQSEPPPAKVDPEDLQGGSSSAASPGATAVDSSAASGTAGEGGEAPAAPEASEPPATADE